MCFEERNTDSRLRSPAASRRVPRTRPFRRSILSLSLVMGAPSLLLAFLAEDALACVFDALALVGLRRPEFANLGGDLADFLAVDAGDHDFHRARRRDGDAFRDRID